MTFNQYLKSVQNDNSRVGDFAQDWLFNKDSHKPRSPKKFKTISRYLDAYGASSACIEAGREAFGLWQLRTKLDAITHRVNDDPNACPRYAVVFQTPLHFDGEAMTWKGDVARVVHICLGGHSYANYNGVPGPAVLLTLDVEGTNAVELAIQPDEARYLAGQLVAMADSWEKAGDRKAKARRKS